MAGRTFLRFLNSFRHTGTPSSSTFLRGDGAWSNLETSVEDFHAIGGAGEPAFQNSWANTGSSPAAFYKDPFGRVYLRGNINTGASGTVAFTLPSGYRPEYNTFHVSYNNNGGPGPGGAAVHIEIQTDGDVIPTYGAGTDVWLDSAHFRAV
ncbi:MAG: hypothetical protein KJO69_09815 [Gammaproteobacteria bacterium]|nr:hypothetical protein [Gammaproteobacteria bacterium]